jgi:hypothetical protein
VSPAETEPTTVPAGRFSCSENAYGSPVKVGASFWSVTVTVTVAVSVSPPLSVTDTVRMKLPVLVIAAALDTVSWPALSTAKAALVLPAVMA